MLFSDISAGKVKTTIILLAIVCCVRAAMLAMQGVNLVKPQFSTQSTKHYMKYNMKNEDSIKLENSDSFISDVY